MGVNLVVPRLIFKAPGENGIIRGMSINRTGAQALGASDNYRARM